MMPGPKCNVRFCSNFNGMLTDEGTKITFHRFPKQSELRNKWLENCQKTGNWNVDYGYVCSEHFQKDDFKRDLQAELLGYKGRRKLKPFTVPCLNLPNGNKVINKFPYGTEAMRCKEEKESHEQLIEECLLSRNEKIPLSYETFKKWIKQKETEKNDKIYSDSELEISKYSNDDTKSLSTKQHDGQKCILRTQLKRNVAMQKKMMEKIFLATFFGEPFSETNMSHVDEDIESKAKSALLKVCALAPKSYNRYAKKLNLPNKDALLTWYNENHLNDK